MINLVVPAEGPDTVLQDGQPTSNWCCEAEENATVPRQESRSAQSYSKLNFALSKAERQEILRGDPVEVLAIAGLGRSLEQETLKVFHLTLSEPGLFKASCCPTRLL